MFALGKGLACFYPWAPPDRTPWSRFIFNARVLSPGRSLQEPAAPVCTSAEHRYVLLREKEATSQL